MNSTVTSLQHLGKDMGEGRGRAIAEALRVNSTLTELNLSDNGLGEGGGRAIAEG
jgi:hypothetical protein